VAATITNHAVSSISGDVTPSSLFVTPQMIDWTKKVRRTDTPLLTEIGRGKAPETPAVKLEWGFSYPDSDNDKVVGTTGTGTTFVVNDASKIQVGSLLYCESEEILVTGVDEDNDTLTTVRGYAGTSAASHATNTTFMIFPPAIAENQATPLSPITQGEKDYNYFQQSEWSIQLSHRAQVVPTQETLSLKLGDRGKAELKKKMADTIPTFLENQLLFGNRAIGTTSQPSTFGGIFNTSSFCTTSAAVSGVLTYGSLMSNLQTVHNLVGNNIGRTIMAHPTVCEIISSFFEDTRVTSGSDTSIKTYWNEFDSGWYGKFTLIPNYKMLKSGTSTQAALDKLIVFDPSDLEMVPLSGDSGWSMDPIATNGWFDQLAIRGDFTLRAQNPDTRLILTGFDTTRSSYAGLS
jgi:hypothetical protein